MYKVFFNDRAVLIGSTFKKSLIQKCLISHPSDLKDMEAAWLFFKNNQQEKDLIILTNNPESAKEMFFSMFTIINAAGGLVSNSENKLLCISRWWKWDLPKGKAEKNEKIEETALREVKEECGITNLRNNGFNSVTYHIYEHPRKPGKWILKQTYWFNMSVSGNEKLVPQINEDIIDARWVSKKDLEMVIENTWASLIPVIKAWTNSE